MNINPLHSVLIAQYNNAEYLEQAIESVFAQTYKNWEIILVDDCSTDNSPEVYKKYSDDTRIRIFYNEINRGCGYTKRRCAELANGEICGFLDPDDILLPNALEATTKIHVQHPEVSIVFSRNYCCDNDLNILRETRLIQIPADKTYFTNYLHDAENYSCYKKEYYDKTKGLNPLYKAGVDAELYFIMEEVGEIYILNEFTYKYRVQKPNSITNNLSKAAYWNLIVRHDTSVRRGLNPEEYSYNDYADTYSNIAQKHIYSAQDKVRNSLAYRLGKLILSPLRIFKS